MGTLAETISKLIINCLIARERERGGGEEGRGVYINANYTVLKDN